VQRFRFHVTAVLTDLDPPVVLGYLQHTRGRRQLRADRIVRIESDDDSQNAP
jgi:DNA polymerase-3 subunit epsilon